MQKKNKIVTGSRCLKGLKAGCGGAHPSHNPQEVKARRPRSKVVLDYIASPGSVSETKANKQKNS